MIPVVGITSYLEPVDRAPWVAQPSAVLPHDYCRKVQDAGGLAVVLPPRLDATRELAGLVLDRVDALIVSGGVDLEACRYGAQPHPTSQSARPDRDAWELALVEEAVARDLPLLGICRGMQVMAVQDGGALEQHVPERVGSDEHAVSPGVWSTHEVEIVPGTRLAGVLGTQALPVPTYHHQAVDPDSLRDSAYRPSAWHADGTLEAMEDPSGSFRLAVQWHPEAGPDGRLFDALIAACRSTAGARD